MRAKLITYGCELFANHGENCDSSAPAPPLWRSIRALLACSKYASNEIEQLNESGKFCREGTLLAIVTRQVKSIAWKLVSRHVRHALLSFCLPLKASR